MTTTHLLDVPYDDRTDAKWAGARWDPSLRRWVYRGDRLPASLAKFAAKPHSWERWLEDDLNGDWSHTTASSGIELRPHQQEASELILDAWVANRPGVLIADAVGLGKTYSVINGAERIGENLNVLVISPLSVIPHWRRSINAHGSRNRWCVINYDRLKNLLEEPESAKNAVRTRTKNKRRATKGESIAEFDIVIADEAHLLRNPQSQRSAAFRQIVKAHGTPAFVVWASATAGQNPLELAYLAPLLASVTGSKVRELDDLENWCRHQGIKLTRGPFGSWRWDPNPEDLAVMRELLFSARVGPPAGIRRRPEEISGWPAQQRILLPIELTAAQQGLYDDAWTEFRSRFDLPATDQNPQGALAALTRFRQKASLLRVEQTAAFVADLVADGFQVPVSVQFLETAERLAEMLTKRGLEVRRLDGTQSPAERERHRIDFQQESAQVIVFTVVEGISLHAGETAVSAGSRERMTVLHDLRWSAIATAQIEGRAHRDGNNAVCYYTFAEGTVEERVASIVLERLAAMSTMIGDDTGELDLLRAALS